MKMYFARHPMIWAYGTFLLFQLFLMLSVDVAEYDEAIYLDVARNIRRTGVALRSMEADGVLYAEHTPLYQYLLTLLTMVMGERLFALRSVTLGLATGCVALVYRVGTALRDKAAGLTAALILGLNAFFSLYSFFIREEVPMCFFLLLALYLLVLDEQRNRIKYVAGAGLLIAIAVLFKEIALAFWGASLLYVLLFGGEWRERLSRSLWIAIPTVTGLVAWIYWVVAYDPRRFQATVDRWYSSAFEGANSSSHLTRELISWTRTVGGDVLGWGTITLLMTGIILSFVWKRRQPRATALLVLYSFVAIGASYIIKLKRPRHVIFVIPAVAILVSSLIDWPQLMAWISQRRPRLLMMVVVCLGLAWNISPLQIPSVANLGNIEKWWAPLFSYRMYENDRYYGILREVGQYLSEQTSPETVITVVHEGPVTGYYADRSYRFLYTRSYEATLQALEATEYLVFDHLVFLNQTEDEIESVLAHIDHHFEIVEIVQDEYRQVSIHRQRQ